MDLATAQKPAVGEYWADYTKQISSFQNGNTVIGTTWQVIANFLQGSDPAVPVEAIKPEEGSTGWSDTWMINSKTANPNCAYKFVNHITSAPINIQIAEYFGEAPGNSKSCALAVNPDHCDIFHAEDAAVLDRCLVLDHPGGRMPRRSHRRDLQGLRGLGGGLDRHPQRIAIARPS